MISYIQKVLPENFDEDIKSENILENSENNFFQQFQYIVAEYKTPVMINEMFSFKIPIENSENLEHIDKKNEKRKNDYYTNSKQYNDDLFFIQIQIIRDENEEDMKTLQIKTINQSTNEGIPHVTYFMKISKGDQLLVSDFFYSENQNMIVGVETMNGEIEIIGDRQYNHNALIAHNEEPIIIKGNIFRDFEEYEFEFELRTIYDNSNWIFSLDGMSVNVII